MTNEQWKLVTELRELEERAKDLGLLVAVLIFDADCFDGSDEIIAKAIRDVMKHGGEGFEHSRRWGAGHNAAYILHAHVRSYIDYLMEKADVERTG